MPTWKLMLVSVALGVIIGVACVVSSLVAEQTRWEAPPLDFQYVSQGETPPVLERLGEHLWSVDGLKVVVASGSPREMGEQYGAAVAEDIKRGIQTYLEDRVIRDQGYSMEYMLECCEAMLPHIAPEYIEEMHGVAEGAGVSYEQVLAMHGHADIVHYGHDWGKPKQEPGEAAGCSNFVVWGPATSDGTLYHGRNLDWTIKSGVQSSSVVYIGIPKSGHPFALVTYAGMIGGVTGMNAKGITFGEMTSSTSDETLAGEPLFLVCRRMLQTCATIADVEGMMGSYQGTTGWNFMVASGNESAGRAFEVDGTDVITFEPDDPKELSPPVSRGAKYALYRTNHPISDVMLKKVAKKHGIENIALGKVALRTMDTWQRYESIRQWISGDYYGKIDARTARAMLQSPPLCAGNNLHSVVFSPGELKMWVANATGPPDPEPAYTQPYHLVELSRFLPK